MGNHRFKLSDLIPNSWVKKMSKTRKKQHQISNSTSFSSSAAVPGPRPHQSDQRKFYYFTRDLTKTRTSAQNLQPPRKPISVKRNRGSSCRATIESVCYSNNSLLSQTSNSDDSVTSNSSWSADKKTFQKEFSIPAAPTITTKTQKTSAEFSDHVKEAKTTLTSNLDHDQSQKLIRVRTHPRHSPSPHGVKFRSTRGRKSLDSSSVAVIMKSSRDPERDFRESMVEMIMENNITASTDLEHLLASYLFLNSNHYHHLIINVFKQIWFDLRLIN